MMTDTAAIISQVRAAAKNGGDAIWTLASLPVPPTPGPAPAPGQPTDPKISLSQTGVLTLSFSCANPAGTSGTIYQIWRKIDGGPKTYLFGVGEKKFSDATIPAGTSTIVYLIQAVRSTLVGEWSTFNVQFGVESEGGMMKVTVTEGAGPKKIAA